jgi:nucleotide sugar dehydrogenase
MAAVAVVGTGHVGTVTAACLAHLGHEVVGLDADPARTGQLTAGQLPFEEPDLADLLRRGLALGRLRFTCDPAAVAEAEVVFFCVGTPAGPRGLPEMSQLRSAAAGIAGHLAPGAVVVNKSTVPVGSGNWMRSLIEEHALQERSGWAVVSNPEFLREGSAVEDFLYPDRIVLGGEQHPTQRVAALYEPIMRQDFARGRADHRPLLVLTSLASAEMIKYAANSFLAAKISFANEIAGICELVGADAREVLPALGADSRIGPKFLRAGIGWGGSCFGKDLAALIGAAAEYGYDCRLLRAAVAINDAAREAVLHKLQATLKVLKGRRVAVLGLTFKAGTDDLRDSPAVDVVRRLLDADAVVAAYDPTVKEVPELSEAGLRVATDAYDAVERADAVVVATDWPDFVELDLPRMAARMRGDLVLDGRGILDPAAVHAAGLRLTGFGW